MTQAINLLIVDDDEEIRHLLADFLRPYGFRVHLASEGETMLSMIAAESIDLIILDVLMPGEDGFSLCKRVRTASNIPIILLTAIGEDADRIIGLEIGADDYVTKPFNPRELLARIKAVLRRYQEGSSLQSVSSTAHNAAKFSIYTFAGWRLNLNDRSLQSPEQLEVILSAGEYDLLVTFLKNPHRVLSRDQLLDMTKNRPAGPFDRSIDVQISRLRYKIELDPKTPTLIKTVRGGGYLFTPEVEKVC